MVDLLFLEGQAHLAVGLALSEVWVLAMSRFVAVSLALPKELLWAK